MEPTGEYSFHKLYENRNFILGRRLQFVNTLYGDICEKLNASAFEYMFHCFEPSKHYTSDSFKIINQYFLEFCKEKFEKYETFFTYS